MSINPLDRSSHNEGVGEDTHLVQQSQPPHQSSLFSKCVSSKAALLILLWSFMVGLFSGMLLNPDLIVATISPFDFSFVYTLSIYMAVGFVTCFFPLAGILADIKYGRYKTIITSICIVLLSLLLLLLSSLSVLLSFYNVLVAFTILCVCGHFCYHFILWSYRFHC